MSRIPINSEKLVYGLSMADKKFIDPGPIDILILAEINPTQFESILQGRVDGKS